MVPIVQLQALAAQGRTKPATVALIVIDQENSAILGHWLDSPFYSRFKHLEIFYPLIKKILTHSCTKCNIDLWVWIPDGFM